MGKSKRNKQVPDPAEEFVRYLAEQLLLEMAAHPGRIEYNTRVLGGMFRPSEVDFLDRAYQFLVDEGLATRADAFISFFGQPKWLAEISDKGAEYAEKLREARARSRQA